MRCCFKLLLILLLHHRLDLQRQTEQVDEARGILVAVQVVAVAEGGDFLHVQAVRRLHARIDAVALHRWVIAHFPMSLANSLSLHGTPADVFPLLDMYLRRFRTDFLWLLKKPLTIYPDSEDCSEKNRENFP